MAKCKVLKILKRNTEGKKNDDNNGAGINIKLAYTIIGRCAFAFKMVCC